MQSIHLKKVKVARSNTIRDINRQVVLNYIRENGVISRADIAKLTELQRSTISQIVDDLIKNEFVEEIGAGASTGGRKPTMLRLQKGKQAVIGVDITPTTTTIATSDLGGNILEQQSFQTDPDVNKTFSEIVKGLKKINNKALQVGVSLPGLVNDIQGRVIFVPFFEWKNWNLKEDLEQETGLSVVIDNDANAISLAELWFGRKEVRNVKNFLTVLVAEGIGTGMIIDGQIYRGHNGVAGEFGHMVVVGTDSVVECSCGSRKCWEALASDTATIARYLIATNQTNPITIDDFIELVKAKNINALKIAKETLFYLGVGIANIVVGLSPETVVVSGKIAQLMTLLAEDVPHFFERNIRQNLPVIQIMASTLGNNPTLMGAISLALSKKFDAVN